MRVLLSAYECKPDTGSEYGLGWEWATSLSTMGYEIWVITLSDSQPKIERKLECNSFPNLNFVYCPMPFWLPQAYKIANLMQFIIFAHMVSQIAKVCWQWDAYRQAKSLTNKIEFDLVHHVTNTTIRRPSFMGLLGLPFIMGPLAGGSRAPWALRKSYPLIGWLIDFLRDIANFMVKFDPLMYISFASASKIYCRSKDSLTLIPKCFRSKTEILFSIPSIPSIPSSQAVKTLQTVGQDLKTKGVFQVLFVGRFLHWKGVHLALKAFAQLKQVNSNVRFTLVGKGRDEAWLKDIAKQLDIEKSINWVSWMSQQELGCVYSQHDVFLFPSLHDSAGMVVLEAMNFGLPVVSLDLGGPGLMVDDTCGRAIKTDGLSEEEVILALSNALLELAKDSELRARLSKGALARTAKFTFQDVIKHIYPKTSSNKLMNYEKAR